MTLMVRLPEPLRRGAPVIAIEEPVANLFELSTLLETRIPGFSSMDEIYNYAVNGEIILHGEKARLLSPGDEVEILISFSGG
ncbi:MAG TPA: MoaD/ThiS family protein [Thermoanaerobaculia bacterium]|nr:MoaD/ThiS family protein [Thermoanaerobaculia bacterium]